MTRCHTSWHRLPSTFRDLAAARPLAILLETSRCDPVNHASYLFLEPKRIIAAWNLNDIPNTFRQIEVALDEGCYVAGFLTYEAGYHFVDIKIDETAVADPLAWFGVYDRPCIFDHRTGTVSCADGLNATDESPTNQAMAPDQRPAPSVPTFGITEAEYLERINAILRLIADGETYQVNFTDQVSFTFSSPAALYATLVDQQSVAYGAHLNLSDHQIISLSPELFFKIQDGRIMTRPMKGTMPRGLDAIEDDAQAARLRHDAKSRAEHIMIVDLLRNDLGRLCQAGSVEVSNPYSVERYQTLHQMVSTVSGRLRPGTGYYEIFASLFPSGSITGAPKIRTMQIIRDLERRPRGIYCGAIGFIAPDDSAQFNVAIRTLALRDGIARMGVGGGIVADSDPRDEYKECLLKTAFLSRRRQDVELFETLLWEGDYRFLDYHLDRLSSSAGYFSVCCDTDWLRSLLWQRSLEFDAGRSYRVRLSLDSTGRPTLQSSALVHRANRGVVRLAADRTSSQDVFRRHKTTVRETYDRLHAQALAAGFDDVLFVNERDEVTEGAISNLFVEKGGLWFTPPVECGVLPGVFRRHLLETRPNTQERILHLEDIVAADALYLCSALRGLRQVHFESAPSD